MKPLTKNKVFRKKFVGDELTGAMNGFFNTKSFNKDSITSMLVEAIRPAKVGTDFIYYDPSDKKGKKVPLCTVYLFDITIDAFEKLEEKGLLVKTEDVKSALGLLKSKLGGYINDELFSDFIDECFPAFKIKPNKSRRKNGKK